MLFGSGILQGNSKLPKFREIHLQGIGVFIKIEE